jgi:hypothetical protein
MKTLQMLRIPLVTLAVLALFDSAAQAQPFVTAGSTPEGDYLRGVGIAAWGMGLYKLNTAQADSINLDTSIRWNEYVAAVAKEQTREYVARKLGAATKVKDFYKQFRERMLKSPEARDVSSGDALNALLEKLENANLGESVFRSERLKVSLPVDMVRHIPFKLAEKGEQFSMERLSLKGKGKWTVAMQDAQFDREKKAYALALDKALEQAIDGRMQLTTIDELEARANDLLLKLNEVVTPGGDRLYIEARDRVKELKGHVRLLKTAKIQPAIGEIEKYSGTTINDLKVFMQKHNLRFATASTPEERELYPELYALLAEQCDKLKSSDSEPGK